MPTQRRILEMHAHRSERKAQAETGDRAPAADRRRPIFVINLREDAERLAFMRRQLDGMGLEFERIEAVDGRAIAEPRRKKLTARSLRPLFAGEIGCHLSHIKAYQIMQERNIPEAVLLEDDVLLHEDFAEVLNGCKLPEECQILQLASVNNDLVRKLHQHSAARLKPLPKGFRMAPTLSNQLWGTQAYLIRLSYARRLLRDGNSIRAPIDLLLFDWEHNLYLSWAAFKQNADGESLMLGRERSFAQKRWNIKMERLMHWERKMRSVSGAAGKKIPIRKKQSPLPVFVLSFKSGAQNPAAAKCLEEGEVPFEVIRADEAERISAETSANVPAANPNADAAQPPDLPAAEIRRYSAHAKAWRAGLQTGAPAAVIVEDNALLGADFPLWFHGGAPAAGYRMADMIFHDAETLRQYFSAHQATPLPHELDPSARPGIDRPWSGSWLADARAAGADGREERDLEKPQQYVDAVIQSAYSRAYMIPSQGMRRLLHKTQTGGKPVDALLFRRKFQARRPWEKRLQGRVERLRSHLLRHPELLHHGRKSQLHRLKGWPASVKRLRVMLSCYSLTAALRRFRRSR